MTIVGDTAPAVETKRRTVCDADRAGLFAGPAIRRWLCDHADSDELAGLVDAARQASRLDAFTEAKFAQVVLGDFVEDNGGRRTQTGAALQAWLDALTPETRETYGELRNEVRLTASRRFGRNLTAEQRVLADWVEENGGERRWGIDLALETEVLPC